MQKTNCPEYLVKYIASNSERRTLPWRSSPGDLFSLLAMKDFFAAYFFRLLKELEARLLFDKLPLSGSDEFLRQGISVESKTELIEAMEKAFQCLAAAGFNDASIQAKAFQGLLQEERIMTNKKVIDEVKMLQRFLEVALLQICVLHIPLTEVHYYNDLEPFGPVVAKKFYRFSRDITEAAKCLALDRTTAVVFHLMRVMEHAVQQFGKNKLSVKIDPQNDEWGGILRKMNDVLNARQGVTPIKSFSKTKREEYSQAIALLGNVKNAWRNRTMHPRVKGYTKSEAERVFHAVKAYLEYLATLK